MTREDKELLLKDLSARLPYGVICNCLHDYHTKASAIDAEDSTVYYPYCDEWESIEYCKPYLRPLSSMTEEEMFELNKIFTDIKLYKDGTKFINSTYDATTVIFSYEMSSYTDWLNKNHFDYRG